MDGRGLDHHVKSPCGALDRAQHQGRERRGGGIVDDEHAADGWRDLRQHLQPFAGQRAVIIGETGDVATGMREVFDKTLADGIGDDGEHDRDRGGAPAQLFHRGRADREQDVRLDRDQLVRKLRDARAIGTAAAPLDPEVVALLPTIAGKRLGQDRAACLSDRVLGGGDREHTEPPHHVPLLGRRRGGERRDHPEKRQTRAAVHG